MGNYPGVTVERKTGFIRTNDNTPRIEVVDLPGAYSLGAHSADEAVVLDVLLGYQDPIGTPDLIVVVVDAAQLARNLFLVSQVVELGRPVVVALNMMDLAARAGFSIDAAVLSEHLGVPVVPVIAPKQKGVDELIHKIVESLGTASTGSTPSFPRCIVEESDGLAASTATTCGEADRRPSRTELLQALLDPGGHHESRLVDRCGAPVAAELKERRERIRAAGESLVEVEAQVRYAWIAGMLDQAVTCVRPARKSRSEGVDRILTHRVFGLAFLVLLMGACFQSIYVWAAPLMDAIDRTVSALGVALGTLLPPGALQSLLVDGVLAGVGAVLVFLPQILILFLFIAILEDCGFMARAAFLLDRWMNLLGLNGSSFIPLLSSFACAVPGIMATRTIGARRDRLVTILIAPLMSCSARLPVYVLFISVFVPAVPLLGGVVGLQAVVLLAMYAIGIVTAVVVALIAKRTILPGKPQPFLMELPSYKWPSSLTVLYRMYEQGKVFCVSAGTIIFAMAIVVWALGYYPRPAAIAVEHQALRITAENEYRSNIDLVAASLDPSLTSENLVAYEPVAAVITKIEAREAAFTAAVEKRGLEEHSDAWVAARDEADTEIARVIGEAGAAGEAASALRAGTREFEVRVAGIRQREAGIYLRQSVLGRAGQWIEPLVKPLGWDWRIGTAAIAALPAREVVIATLATLYNLGGEQDETSASLRTKLRAATWPDGRPVFSFTVALSIMVFFALCCQCGATLAVIKRETNSWRWPLFTFSYMTVLAYLGALVTYQIASRIV